VSVINSGINKVVATIPVGVHPIDIDAFVETPAGSSPIEIIPPASFILGVFERLNQNDYDTFTKVLTPTEKNDLLTSPDEGNLDNFLNKLSPVNLDNFLNKLSPSEIKQISNILTTSEFNLILQKLPQDENKKITSRIQSASSSVSTPVLSDARMPFCQSDSFKHR
jgi:hypothetical protein